MSKPVFTFIALIILSSCGNKEKTTVDPNANAETTLRSLNNSYDSALIHRDTAFLQKLYAEDFVYTSPEGKLLNKNQQILNIAFSEMKWESGKSEDVQLKFYDDVAIMTGSFKAKGTYRGNPVDIHERYTAVWQKKDTAWKMIAEQGNIVQQ